MPSNQPHTHTPSSSAPHKDNSSPSAALPTLSLEAPLAPAAHPAPQPPHYAPTMITNNVSTASNMSPMTHAWRAERPSSSSANANDSKPPLAEPAPSLHDPQALPSNAMEIDDDKAAAATLNTRPGDPFCAIGVLSLVIGAPGAALDTIRRLALFFQHTGKSVCLLDLNDMCLLTAHLLPDEMANLAMADELLAALSEPLLCSNLNLDMLPLPQPRNIPSLPGIQLVAGSFKLHQYRVILERAPDLIPEGNSKGIGALRYMLRQLADRYGFNVILIHMSDPYIDSTKALVMNCDYVLPLTHRDLASFTYARSIIDCKLRFWWDWRELATSQQEAELALEEDPRAVQFTLPRQTYVLPLLVCGLLASTIDTEPPSSDTDNRYKVPVRLDFPPDCSHTGFEYIGSLIPEEARLPEAHPILSFLSQSSHHRITHDGYCNDCDSPFHHLLHVAVEEMLYEELVDPVLKQWNQTR